MAYEASQPLKDTAVAGADLTGSQYRFVKLTAAGLVVPCNAATDVPYGVLQNNPPAGVEAEIVVAGITKVKVGASLANSGVLIGTDNQGRAVAKVAGTDTTHYVVGVVRAGAGGADRIATATVNCASPSRAA